MRNVYHKANVKRKTYSIRKVYQKTNVKRKAYSIRNMYQKAKVKNVLDREGLSQNKK